MDATFPHAEATDAALKVCRCHPRLVKALGQREEDAACDLVSFVWSRWAGGEYDPAKSAFFMWAARKANCHLVDLVRAEHGDPRRPSGAGGRIGRGNIVAESLKIKVQADATIKIDPTFRIPEGEPVYLRRLAKKRGAGRLGYDLRPLGRAIQHRKAVGCSWRQLQDELKTNRELAKAMGFCEVPGIATFWRLKRKLSTLKLKGK